MTTLRGYGHERRFAMLSFSLDLLVRWLAAQEFVVAKLDGLLSALRMDLGALLQVTHGGGYLIEADLLAK